MTFDINEYWGVTVSHGVKVGPKQWEASAQVFRRDSFQYVGDTFIGVGTTMNTADDDAFRKAKGFVYTLEVPENWEA